MQEAFLRYQEAEVEPESPRAYLATITTRLAIDELRSARSRREVYPGEWLPEPLVDDDAVRHAETADTLSLAFLHLLEKLSPVERAVFLLREVFDYPYEEVARIVDKSPENCRQILARAHRRVQEGSGASTSPARSARRSPGASSRPGRRGTSTGSSSSSPPTRPCTGTVGAGHRPLRLRSSAPSAWRSPSSAGVARPGCGGSCTAPRSSTGSPASSSTTRTGGRARSQRSRSQTAWSSPSARSSTRTSSRTSPLADRRCRPRLST